MRDIDLPRGSEHAYGAPRADDHGMSVIPEVQTPEEF